MIFLVTVFVPTELMERLVYYCHCNVIKYRMSSNSSCVTKWVPPFKNEIIYQRGKGELGASTTDIALLRSCPASPITHTKKNQNKPSSEQRTDDQIADIVVESAVKCSFSKISQK